MSYIDSLSSANLRHASSLQTAAQAQMTGNNAAPATMLASMTMAERQTQHRINTATAQLAELADRLFGSSGTGQQTGPKAPQEVPSGDVATLSLAQREVDTEIDRLFDVITRFNHV